MCGKDSLKVRDEIAGRDGGLLLLKDLLEGRTFTGVFEVKFFVVFGDDGVEGVAFTLADQILEAGLVIDSVMFQSTSLTDDGDGKASGISRTESHEECSLSLLCQLFLCVL